MAREAEAEAWVHKHRRIIQNQTLIQLLMILAIITPWPLAGLVFWIVFGLGSPIIIQSILASWATSSVIYIALAAYVRIKQKEL